MRLFPVVGLLSLLLAGCVVEQAAPPPIPAPRVEVVPPQPTAQVVWQPGGWHWNGGAYVWQPGHYIERIAARGVWVPGHWQGGGWVPGHWG